MSVVPMEQLRLKKQITFERNLLRELTMEEVQKDVRDCFQPFFHSYYVYDTAIREEAIEQAMEAYLLGAEASQFLLCGVSEEEISERYEVELKTISLDFFDYLDYWQQATSHNGWFTVRGEKVCTDFFLKWWNIGLEKGERRRRLKLD
ncbi:DUF2521 family protein [Pontibacillus yanchengensis]|uniref:DUF2521 family protein n=1 Tax=Pontibacillus yanchengensis Y32 TaxID=1385514 RepID=A0A0A2T626_9BACI|nr:DUF2521 family protein [Pontibacillus yanchengensis]KGP70939.1 hypothetical protein N782_08810 [Pontibacillus yanchengensis Y32]